MNCGNHIALRWVAGNDVTLRVRLFAIRGDETEREPFALYDEDEVTVTLRGAYRSTVLPAERDGEDTSSLVVSVPWTVSKGIYGLGVAIVRNGGHLRTMHCGVIEVTECSCGHGGNGVPVTGCGKQLNIGIDMEIEMLLAAVTHAKNAYELWLEQPGNEGKTLDEFLDWYVSHGELKPATHDSDGLLTAEDKRLIDALREMTDITDEDIVSWFYGEQPADDSQG